MKPDIAFILGLAKVFLFCNKMMHSLDKNINPLMRYCAEQCLLTITMLVQTYFISEQKHVYNIENMIQ